MHDIRLIRENPNGFDAALARRGVSAMSSDILALDEARRAKILAAETAQAEQNKASKEVGKAKASGDEAEFERLRALVAETKSAIATLQDEAKTLDAQLTDMLMGIPNLPYDDVHMQWIDEAYAWLQKYNPAYIPADGDAAPALISLN